MNDEKEPPHGPSPNERPIDIQRRAVRAAVRARLRGEVTPSPTKVDYTSSHQQCYSSGDLSLDVAFHPLIHSDI
jgi:hypothetical protein